MNWENFKDNLNEAKKKDAWLQIVDIHHNHQSKKVHGILVDAQTAQLLNKVYDSLKERKNKKSFINAINKNRKGLETMVNFSWSMVKKESIELDEKIDLKKILKKIKMDKFSRSERKKKKDDKKRILN